jgi:hypothetical protein
MTYSHRPHPAKNPPATIQSQGQPRRGLPFLFVTWVSTPATKGFLMRTEKQIAASRENGRNSGYPLGHATTPEGKARIVNANLICGIDAETEVLIWERRNELDELKDEYYASHPPASPEARCLLDQIIRCEWHLRRFASAESSLWDQLYNHSPEGIDACAYTLEKGGGTFARLQHRINSTRRAFHTALKELERLEARDLGAPADTPAPDPPATHSPATRLHVLGSLPRNDSGNPAAQVTLANVETQGAT